MEIIRLLKGMMVFVLGILVGIFIVYLQFEGFENPFASSVVGENAPSDWIAEDNIHIYPDRVVIDISGATMSRYAPTGSMRPVFDQGANGIRVVPQSEADIQLG